MPARCTSEQQLIQSRVLQKRHHRDTRSTWTSMEFEVQFLQTVVLGSEDDDEIRACFEAMAEVLQKACRHEYQKYRFSFKLHRFLQHDTPAATNWRSDIRDYKRSRRNAL